MTNHVHIVFRSVNDVKPEILLGNFKRYTSKAVVNAIINNPRESRKKVLLEQFKKAGAKSSILKSINFGDMTINQLSYGVIK